MGDITNETLAALMKSNHAETVRRLDKIDQKQEITNGRLGKAEVAIAVLQSKGESDDRQDDAVVEIPKKWISIALAVGGGIGAAAVKFLGR